MIRVAVNNTDFNITSPFLNDSNTNVVTDHSGALIAGITVVCVLVLLGLGYSKFSQSIMFRNTEESNRHRCSSDRLQYLKHVAE